MVSRIWKEVVVAYFNVLSQHSPGKTKKNHEKSLPGWIASNPAKIQTGYLPVGLLLKNMSIPYDFSKLI
jgi:hypothetical protein